MTARTELERIAHDWIALWCVPVDWSAFDRLHADRFEDHAPAGRPADRAGFAAGLAELVRAFPDLHTVVEDLVVDADRSRVAIRWSARGTNRARFLGTGPTGRHVALRGIEVIEVANGRIVRRWGEWDVSDHVQGR